MSIPKQKISMIIILLSKCNGEYWGIGLLKPFWRCVGVIMNGRLSAIQFNDCPHGFLNKKVAMLATMETKLAQ